MGFSSLVSRDDSSQIGRSAEQELPSQAALTRSSVSKGEGTRGTSKARKVRKRKSRAVAKPPIQLLSADKSSFKDLVLHLTGKPPSSSSSSSSPPSLHTHAHTTAPSYLSHASPFSNDALLTLSNSLANYPINSQNPSLSFGKSISPLPTSPSSNGGHPTSPPLSDGAHANALFHSSPYSSSSQGAGLMIQGENQFTNMCTLEFLQALKQSLLQIKKLGEFGSFNFGMLEKTNNHDVVSNNGNDDGNDVLDLKPLLASQLHHTLENINTYLMECVDHMKSLDVEHVQNLWRVKELENFLLTKDDKLDDLFTNKVLDYYLNTCLSCDRTHIQNHFLELADKCL